MPATLIYDSQCPFCARSAKRLQRFAGADRLAILSLHSSRAMELHPDLDFVKAMKAVHLVLENGYLCSGAEAGYNAVALRPGLGILKYPYYFPVIRQISDAIYALIAKRRQRCEACES